MSFCCEICGKDFDYDEKLWTDSDGDIHDVCKMCNEMLLFDFGKEQPPLALLFKY